MTQKTLAESIAELRNTLESIESSTPATIPLQESTKPVCRLQEHMQDIEQEYLAEAGLLGTGWNALTNYARGLKFGKAKGALEKNPKVSGQKATWSRGSKTTADKVANTAGKLTTSGALAGATGLGAVTADRYMHDQPMPWDKTNQEVKPETNVQPQGSPETNTEVNPVGTDAKPQGIQSDPKIAELQKYLNGMGENLVVDGKFGRLTKAALERHQHSTSTAPHPAAHQTAAAQAKPNIDIPPELETPPAAQASGTPPAGSSDAAEMRKVLDQWKEAMAELQGLTKNDPQAQSELKDIQSAVGF